MSRDDRQKNVQPVNLFGELAFSVVVETEAMLTMRSLGWYGKIGAARAGIPFLVAHDLGLLFINVSILLKHLFFYLIIII